MTSLSIYHFLTLSAALFSIGLCGIFINRDNIIKILISLEIVLLGININFISFSAFLQDFSGQIFTIAILTIAGAEMAIGLAILITHYQKNKNIDIKEISQIKG
jgi:NADH-quinone oxidoreductase subunit K